MTERRYLIEADDAGCSAYAPDLPGCAATGATREDVEREMRDAIAFHLEALKTPSSVPEPSDLTTAYVKVAAQRRPADPDRVGLPSAAAPEPRLASRISR